MFLTPGWVAMHLFVWSVVVAMVLLGRWQLRVSNSKHFDLQNFGYALQWWAFSAFAVLLWLRMLRDALRGKTADVTTSGELVLRGNQTSDIVYTGPANLVSRTDRSGKAPVTYRGYVMPQSATSPANTGDPMHANYNDYLWQLALADSAGQVHRSDAGPRQSPESGTRTSNGVSEPADHFEGSSPDVGPIESGRGGSAAQLDR